MTTIFTAIFSKYLLSALLTIMVGVFTKISLKYFGNDRTATIKDTILTAMLWAEETYGIGNGPEKWNEAWNKIQDLLALKNIKLSKKEKALVEIEMTSNIPEINAIAYSTVPEPIIQARKKFIRDQGTADMISKLNAKHIKAKKH